MTLIGLMMWNPEHLVGNVDLKGNMFHQDSFIHLFSLYTSQNHGGPGVYPGNAGSKVREFTVNGSPVHHMAP